MSDENKTTRDAVVLATVQATRSTLLAVLRNTDTMSYPELVRWLRKEAANV